MGEEIMYSEFPDLESHLKTIYNRAKSNLTYRNISAFIKIYELYTEGEKNDKLDELKFYTENYLQGCSVLVEYMDGKTS